jgi:DNA-directed RNA polymerase subunit RPC12/RpoP
MDPLVCKDCGGELRRSKRKPLERIRYAEAYRCKDCGLRLKISVRSRVADARYTKCPKCRCHDLSILKKVDKIDTMRKSIWSYLNRFLGGKLYHCWFCRLQFYDLRPRKHLVRPVNLRLDTERATKSSEQVAQMFRSL